MVPCQGPLLRTAIIPALPEEADFEATARHPDPAADPVEAPDREEGTEAEAVTEAGQGEEDPAVEAVAREEAIRAEAVATLVPVRPHPRESVQTVCSHRPKQPRAILSTSPPES